VTTSPSDSPAVERRRRRRRGLIVAISLCLLTVGGGVGLTHVAATNRASDAGSPATPPPSTDIVVRANLVDQQSVRGTVGFGPASVLSGSKPGVLTWLPEVDTVIKRGERLYRVDNDEVPLFIGTAPLYRPLTWGVSPGWDVKLLQKNLAELGYDVDADGTFDRATAQAIWAWQKDLGIKPSGIVEPNDVVVRAEPVRIDGVSAQLGDQAEGQLMTVTGIDRVAVATVSAAEQRLMQPGTELAVNATDLTEPLVGEVASLVPDDGADDESNSDGEQRFVATIVLSDKKAAKTLPPGSRVSFVIDGEQREHVLAVPVSALLALREGGYAVEVIENDQRRLLPVETGLFADGLVEVSGDGLNEGMPVVTAS
jgi:peptidoglycan hydrolase-like protein with peptidoglycan-binding domain